MARTSGTRPLKLGPWPQGVNNVADEKRLPTNEMTRQPVALREAVNVDLDVDGVPARRRGYQRVVDGTLTHSLWKHPDLEVALFVDADELHLMRPDASVVPLGVFAGPVPLSYALLGAHVAWTSPVACGMLTADLSPMAWAPECPGGVPTLHEDAGLSLGAGRYQVVTTFVDSLGRESGCDLAAQIQIEGGGILLTDIPQPLSADIVAINVYLTDSNDQVLRRHSTLPVGVDTLLIGSQATGRALETQFLMELPAGQITALFNGRQYVADGHLLRWSPPLRYGLTDPVQHVMSFHAPIDVIVPIDRDGLLVAAGDTTFWFGGDDPSKFTTDRAYGAGAVPGSLLMVPGAALGGTGVKPVWLARDGQFVVGDAGKVSPMNLDRAAVPNADRAALLLREEDGLKQLVAALRGPQAQGLAITDAAVAHVIYAQT